MAEHSSGRLRLPAQATFAHAYSTGSPPRGCGWGQMSGRITYGNLLQCPSPKDVYNFFKLKPVYILIVKISQYR